MIMSLKCQRRSIGWRDRGNGQCAPALGVTEKVMECDCNERIV
jgi:hypothetical protein